MSDDYDYQNGEEVMGSIDAEFSEKADAAFEKIDKDLKEGIINWADLCTNFFGMEEPNHEDKAQWTLYVMARSAMMGAVNHRARLYKKTWNLFIHKAGVSVVKASQSDMVSRAIHARMKRVAHSCRLIESRLKPLATNLELNAKDRRIVRQMLDVSRGSQMAISGMVGRLDAIRKNDKQLLLSLFEIDYGDDEEDF